MNQLMLSIVLSDLQHTNQLLQECITDRENLSNMLVELQEYTERKNLDVDYADCLLSEVAELQTIDTSTNDPGLLVCALHEVADINYFRLLLAKEQYRLNLVSFVLDPLEERVITWCKILSSVQTSNVFLLEFKKLGQLILSLYDNTNVKRASNYVHALNSLSFHKLHSSLLVKNFLKNIESKTITLRR